MLLLPHLDSILVLQIPSCMAPLPFGSMMLFSLLLLLSIMLFHSSTFLSLSDNHGSIYAALTLRETYTPQHNLNDDHITIYLLPLPSLITSYQSFMMSSIEAADLNLDSSMSIGWSIISIKGPVASVDEVLDKYAPIGIISVDGRVLGSG